MINEDDLNNRLTPSLSRRPEMPVRNPADLGIGRSVSPPSVVNYVGIVSSNASVSPRPTSPVMSVDDDMDENFQRGASSPMGGPSNNVERFDSPSAFSRTDSRQSSRNMPVHVVDENGSILRTISPTYSDSIRSTINNSPTFNSHTSNNLLHPPPSTNDSQGTGRPISPSTVYPAASSSPIPSRNISSPNGGGESTADAASRPISPMSVGNVSVNSMKQQNNQNMQQAQILQANRLPPYTASTSSNMMPPSVDRVSSPRQHLQYAVDTDAAYSSERAAFSGFVTLLTVLILIVDIVSTAVPHWGYFMPHNRNYYFPDGVFPSGNRYTPGISSSDLIGHFGPFQQCKQTAYSISYCVTTHFFTPSGWLIVAGVTSVCTIVLLFLLSIFSILHVAMRVQRRHIFVTITTAVFLNVVLSSFTVISSVLTVGFGSIQFTLSGFNTSLRYTIGACYYLQIISILVCAILFTLNMVSYRKERRNPSVFLLKTSKSYPDDYELNSTLPRSNSPASPMAMSRYGHNTQQQPYSITNSDNHGFTPVSLVAPMPVQSSLSASHPPIRTVQPGIAQPFTNLASTYSQQYQQYVDNESKSIGGGLNETSGASFYPSSSSDYYHNGGGGGSGVLSPPPVPPHGVSLMPGGRGMGVSGTVANNNGGSMESLNSTNSSTLSTTSSIGSAHMGPFRSSMKKTKSNRSETQSINSETSSKRVRISLGAEQTCV